MGRRADDTWRQWAACKNMEVTEFFIEPATPRVLAACKSCTVRQQCYEYAMQKGIVDGIWGGLNLTQRRTKRRREQREKRRLYAVQVREPATLHVESTSRDRQEMGAQVWQRASGAQG